MTFEGLVILKKELCYLYDNLSLKSNIDSNINLIETANNSNFDYSTLLQLCHIMLEQNSTLLAELEKSITSVDESMTAQGLTLLQDTVYYNKFSDDSLDNDDVLLEIQNEVESILQNVIYKYVSWEHPALYLNCRDAKRIDYMVASDPLYIAGPDMRALNTWVAKYTELYQQRLRLYKIEQGNLLELPQHQFGFIFCWEYFNRITVDRIEQHLRNIFDLLKPGGTFLFSYTNAEIMHTAQLVDMHLAPWASKTYIEKLLLSIGYDIINFVDLPINEHKIYASWAEVKKPGQLSTLKKSPVLGQIKQK